MLAVTWFWIVLAGMFFIGAVIGFELAASGMRATDRPVLTDLSRVESLVGSEASGR
jgi:hypothetical protein